MAEVNEKLIQKFKTSQVKRVLSQDESFETFQQVLSASGGDYFQFEEDKRLFELSGENEHWVNLIEDGCDLATSKKCRVNIKYYLNKYNFKTAGKEIKDPQKLYFLKLNQEEFEIRGFLEMLHYAS